LADTGDYWISHSPQVPAFDFFVRASIAKKRNSTAEVRGLGARVFVCGAELARCGAKLARCVHFKQKLIKAMLALRNTSNSRS
jgi:hypothetical protein